MISDKDRQTILDCSRKYRNAHVFLFGSSLNENEKSNDIDKVLADGADEVWNRFVKETGINAED